MDSEQRVVVLEKVMAQVGRFSPHYDDVLHEVCARIDASGSVGKSDIAVLAFWKRIRTDSWSENFLSCSEARVRDVTAPVVVAAREPDLIAAASNARELLRVLPGFKRGSAMSSAVLTAIRPGGFAVYDSNADKGLERIGLDLAADEPDHYAAYMCRVEQCRTEAKALRDHRWSAHEVDLALYVLGKTPGGR
jgi:hypothetical protein